MFLYKIQIILPIHNMELGIWICFLKHFRDTGHLVSPFELQSCQAVCTLFDQVNFLLIVSTPEIELLMQSFVEIRFTTLSYDVVLICNGYFFIFSSAPVPNRAAFSRSVSPASCRGSRCGFRSSGV